MKIRMANDATHGSDSDGSLEHVPVHITLELENVREENIGGDGTQQRSAFERLLASNLSTASRLEAACFQVSSMSVLQGGSRDASISTRAPRVSVLLDIDIVACTRADKDSQFEDEALGRGASIAMRAAAALDLVQVR